LQELDALRFDLLAELHDIIFPVRLKKMSRTDSIRASS